MITKYTDTPVEVFYSYAPADEDMRDELERHLAGLKRQGLITGWHDRKVGPGEDYRRVIDERLATARVVLLLISATFLASDACYEEQLKPAMERNARGEARVIPVILRDCDWRIDPLDRLLPLPKEGRPIASWKSRDKAFASVARGIRDAVEAVRVHQVEARAVEAHTKQTGAPPSEKDRREIRSIGRHLGPFIAGSRILWADDHPSNNTAERLALAELQVEVHTCLNTEDALEALADGTRYDLVLSDWKRAPQKKEGLPEGLRLLRAMRKQRILTPLIFYTGFVGGDMFKVRRTKAIAAGASGLTASPGELLRWAIAELVRSSAYDPESAFAVMRF